MDARVRTIRNILYSGDQYLVPFFQRRYAWKRDHWNRLRDDLWLLKDGDLNRQHFLGPLVCTPERPVPGELPRYLLIDGQQRLTTLSVILIALRDAAREHGLGDLAAEVEEDYLTHKRKTDLQHYKILPRVEDRAVLIGLINGKIAKEDRKSGIFRSWRFFRKQIEQSLNSHADGELRQLLAIITDRLSLVVITIDDENPYEIFESLNSTGLPLEQSDLIRNFLFMQIPVAKQQDFNQESWLRYEPLFEPVDELPDIPQTAFYRNFLMRDGQYIDARQIYVHFKTQNQARSLSPVDQVDELIQFAQIESMLRRPSTVQETELSEALARIGALEITTAHPLLMNLIARFQRKELSLESLLEAIGDLESFALRRSICGESTRAYGRWFVEAINDIKDDPVENLRNYWGRRGWPDDDAFVERLQTFQVYRREPRKLRLMLERLEDSHGHKEKVSLEKLTVEHVMPQTIANDTRGKSWREVLGEDWAKLHEDWVHTVGNLTLTGYNPELSNRSFQEKKTELRKSNLELNRSIADYEQWDVQAIAERGELLASEVSELWPRPIDSGYEPPEEEPDLTMEQRRQLRRQHWRKLIEKTGDSLDMPSLPKATSRGYIGFATGRGGVKYWASMNALQHRVAISVRLRGGNAEENYQSLLHSRAAIDEELDGSLDWHVGQGETYFISAHLPGIELTTPAGQASALDWQVCMLADFVRVFGPRIRQLKGWRPIAKERSVTRQLQLEFWTEFAERLVEETDLERAHKPRAQYWFDIPVGRSFVHISNTFSPQKDAYSVRVYFNGKRGDQLLDLLMRQQAEIEAEIGETLEWNPRPDNKEKVVVLELSGNLADRDEWPGFLDWMIEMTERFRATFGPRLKRLKLEDASGDADED